MISPPSRGAGLTQPLNRTTAGPRLKNCHLHIGRRAHRRHQEGAEPPLSPPPPPQSRGQNLRRPTSIPAAEAEGPRGPFDGHRGPLRRRRGNLDRPTITIISRATSALPSIYQARDAAAKYLILEIHATSRCNSEELYGYLSHVSLQSPNHFNRSSKIFSSIQFASPLRLQEPVIPWEALVAAAAASGAIPKRKPQSGGGAHAHKQPQPTIHPKRAKEEGGAAPPPPLTPTSILRPQTATSKRQVTKV